MSYILDALKRSELQRNATKIPTVAAPLGVLVESANPGRVRRVIAAVLLAAAIAGLSWWFGLPPFRQVPASAPMPVPTQATASIAHEKPAIAPASTAPVAEPSDQLPRLKLAVTIPQRVDDLGPAAAGASRERTAQAKPVTPGQENASTPLPLSDRGGATSIVGYGDLPAAVRQALPKLAINGFASGDGGATMVVVDDRLLREGDEAAPGVRIERILPDGVEFSYKGYRFRR